MKSTPMSPDLDALWKRLGVQKKGDDAALDDLAPEAAIRRAISARPADASNDCAGGEHRLRLQFRTRAAAHPAEAKIASKSNCWCDDSVSKETM
jgi:hypothetical protein